MKYKADRTLVLANIGFDENRPYFLLNDLEAKTQEYFYPLGKVFSLKKLKKRYCIGSFDLSARTRQACHLAVELPVDVKEDMCPACREITGFNPAFYNTPSISPQQRAYNATPHFTYLAYFSPNHVKAGITSEVRGIARLLEQGARAALVAGRFSNADEARELEARLCASPGIFETMRSSKKAELLTETHYDFSEARRILLDTMDDFGIAANEECLDLERFYFDGSTPSLDNLRLPNDEAKDVCAGRCIGMVGPLAVFEQEGVAYVTSLKEWEAHAVELFPDEIVHTYSFEPIQMSLL